MQRLLKNNNKKKVLQPTLKFGSLSSGLRQSVRKKYNQHPLRHRVSGHSFLPWYSSMHIQLWPTYTTLRLHSFSLFATHPLAQTHNGAKKSLQVEPWSHQLTLWQTEGKVFGMAGFPLPGGSGSRQTPRQPPSILWWGGFQQAASQFGNCSGTTGGSSG